MPGLRLLAVVERYPPVLGSDRRIIELLRRLPAEFEVTICVFPPLLGPADVPPAQDEPRFRVLRLPRGKRGSLAMAPFLIARSTFRALAMRPAKSCDIVLANHPSVTTGLAAWAIARMARVPLVVDFNDLIAQYAVDLLNVRSRLLAGMLHRVQGFIVSRAAGLLLVTEFLRNHVPSGMGPVPTAVIPNGVDLGSYEGLPAEPSPAPTFRMAYAGRYEPWAGSEILEGLARELSSRSFDFEILVAGASAPAHPLPGIKFLGMLAPTAIPALLASSDGILVPFPSGPTSDAASPLKLFEAWAAGRPTLASDVAGIREVARDGQDTILLSPDDVQGWADAVESLAGDPSKRRRLGEGAREAAARSSWENRAEAFSKLLHEVRRS